MQSRYTRWHEGDVAAAASVRFRYVGVQEVDGRTPFARRIASVVFVASMSSPGVPGAMRLSSCGLYASGRRRALSPARHRRRVRVDCVGARGTVCRRRMRSARTRRRQPPAAPRIRAGPPSRRWILGPAFIKRARRPPSNPLSPVSLALPRSVVSGERLIAWRVCPTPAKRRRPNAATGANVLACRLRALHHRAVNQRSNKWFHPDIADAS
jgi:hypothetical protein